MYMGIQLESIQPAPKIAHLRNLYEASVTAALFMIITFEVTKIDNHKNDGKIAHFPPPTHTFEAHRGRSAEMSSEWKVNETAREATSGHLMRHDADHARRRARILKRDAARAPLGRPRTPRI